MQQKFVQINLRHIMAINERIIMTITFKVHFQTMFCMLFSNFVQRKGHEWSYRLLDVKMCAPGDYPQRQSSHVMSFRN